MSQIVSFTGYTPAARFDNVHWTVAKVEEASQPNGPWTLIDTLTLTPADADPTHPQPRNLTTEKASDTPGLWYRLIFLDASGNTGQPTSPVQNGAPELPQTPFATAADLAMRLGLILDTEEDARAEQLLLLASGLIQDEVKQTISLVTDDTLTMPGTTDEIIKLPQRPVVSVSSVTLDGVPLAEGGDWYIDGNAIRRIPTLTALVTGGIHEEAMTFPLGTGFGWEIQTLEIVYTHGYTVDEIPQSVKAICLEMVVRTWVNPATVARETIGNMMTVYDNNRFSPSGLLMTDGERFILRRLFGRPAKSVTIGL